MSVTVVHGDAEELDALTKPFFFVAPGSAEGKRILGKFPGVDVMLISLRGDKLVYDKAGDPGRFHGE